MGLLLCLLDCFLGYNSIIFGVDQVHEVLQKPLQVDLHVQYLISIQRFDKVVVQADVIRYIHVASNLQHSYQIRDITVHVR